MKTRPLSDALGLEIQDLDLKSALGANIAAELTQLLHRHGVLLFRGQDLDGEAQLRFARLFGEVISVSHDETPAMYRYVANCEVEGDKGILPDGPVDCHYDACFRARPYKILQLMALTVPSQGGETVFRSGWRAFEALPEALKAQIQSLHALNAYWLGATHRAENPIRSDSLQQVYPVVTLHPDTGRPVLYVNRLMTQHIVGMAERDSDRLLEALFDHLEQPEFAYAHQWSVGDLIMWDNRCVAHSRRGFPADETRILRRILLAGEAPQAVPAVA